MEDGQTIPLLIPGKYITTMRCDKIFAHTQISQPYNGAVVLLLLPFPAASLPCCFTVPSGKFSTAAKRPKMIGFWIFKCL